MLFFIKLVNHQKSIIFTFLNILSRFLLVLATNQPDQLDRAINDRIDELVGFTLPKEAERRRLIKYYYTKYIKEEK